jgi:hypothetical protein
MQIRPTAFTIGLIIYSFIALFFVYTEFGIDSDFLYKLCFPCFDKQVYRYCLAVHIVRHFSSLARISAFLYLFPLNTS